MGTKLEEDVQKLMVYKLITSIPGIISDRAKRKYEKIGVEIGEKFKNKQKLPENSSLIAELKWSDEAINWARKMSLGIEEFKQAYPKYGEKLGEMIQKHKEVRRAYLEFGIRRGYLPESICLEVIRDVIPGIDDKKAREFYNFIKELKEVLGKKEKGLQKLLLPE